MEIRLNIGIHLNMDGNKLLYATKHIGLCTVAKQRLRARGLHICAPT